MNLIGNNIKIIRKQIGLTQEELALHIGVTPQAVSRWENGVSMPTLDNLIVLAAIFNVAIDDIIVVDNKSIMQIGA